MNLFQRQAKAFDNDLKRSCGALIGIAQGVLADGDLNEREILFLRDWLTANENIGVCWPGSAIMAQVNCTLADGVITAAERDHLVRVLQQLVGGALEDLAASTHVCELALDRIDTVTFPGSSFCFTGDFVFGPRATCQSHTERLGGAIATNVSKRLTYLVVGGLGSPEWKHGSFGTKIEKAIALRDGGAPLRIVHEDAWAASITP